MLRRTIKPSFSSFVSALSAISSSKKPRVCLFLLLILTCGFVAFPVRAQECPQSVIFADDFESDPASRWTIRRELACFKNRNSTGFVYFVYLIGGSFLGCKRAIHESHESHEITRT